MLEIFLRPSLAAFARACTRATLGRAITHTFAVGVILGATLGFVHWLGASGAAAEIVTMAVMTALQLVAALIVAQAFLFVIARALGGHGDFATQAYLSALAFASLFGIASLADSVARFRRVDCARRASGQRDPGFARAARRARQPRVACIECRVTSSIMHRRSHRLGRHVEFAIMR